MLAGIAIGILIFFFVILYNTLIGKKNRIEEAFSGIDVQLKKRYDLIPNLVETVKQFMNHEKELLENVTKLRNQAMQSNNNDEKIGFENQITAALGQLRVAVEAYPDLKSNQNFMQLQRTWNEIEEQLAASRRFFNSAVVSYNNGVEMFPTNIIASMMGYKRKQVFEIPEAEKKSPIAKELFS